MAAPEPDFLQAVRDYAALSAADRRAIDSRLSPEERTQIKVALKHAANKASAKVVAAPSGAAFRDCSPALATRLSSILGASSGVSNVTEHTRLAVAAVASKRARAAT